LKAKNKTKAMWQIICRRNKHTGFWQKQGCFPTKRYGFKKNDPVMNIEKTVAIFFNSDQFIDFPANHQWFLMTMK
jgi:hypothetical protein